MAVMAEEKRDLVKLDAERFKLFTHVVAPELAKAVWGDEADIEVAEEDDSVEEFEGFTAEQKEQALRENGFLFVSME
jgi:hypothetical protein